MKPKNTKPATRLPTEALAQVGHSPLATKKGVPRTRAKPPDAATAAELLDLHHKRTDTTDERDRANWLSMHVTFAKMGQHRHSRPLAQLWSRIWPGTNGTPEEREQHARLHAELVADVEADLEQIDREVSEGKRKNRWTPPSK